MNGAVRHRTLPGPEGVERRLSAVDGQQFQVLERAKDRSQEAPARAKTPERGSETGSAPPRSRSRQRGKGVERDM